MSEPKNIRDALSVEVLRCIDLWLKTRESEGYRGGSFFIDAEHSMRGGLLGRLLEGKPPLPRPPQPP